MASPNAVINTTDVTCSVCNKPFNNGALVCLIYCRNGSVKHTICRDCTDAWDGLAIGMAYGQGHYGLDCPICKEPFTTMTVFRAENFYTGRGTEADPIVIDS